MPTEPSTLPPAAPPRRLQRLPGRTPTFRSSRSAARTSLWMDDTQLLQESVRGYTQEIQRFALADIQAVQIRRTPRGLWYNVILCALLALPAYGLVSILVSPRPDTGGVVALSITVAVFGILLLVNTVRGPTCRTVLTTALGPQPLASLCRMRVARRALDTITTGVEAIQGTLPFEEAARQVDQARANRPPFPPATTYPGYNY